MEGSGGVEVPFSAGNLRCDKKQQGYQDQWWDMEVVWGKTLDVALAVFDKRDWSVLSLQTNLNLSQLL